MKSARGVLLNLKNVMRRLYKFGNSFSLARLKLIGLYAFLGLRNRIEQPVKKYLIGCLIQLRFVSECKTADLSLSLSVRK